MSLVSEYFPVFLVLNVMHGTGQFIPEYLPGIPAYDVHSSSFDNGNITSTSTVIQCQNNTRLDCDGCHQQIVCDYDGNVLARIKCPTTRPYCSKTNGQCISTPPKECSPFLSYSTVKKSDLCPSTGFYPDPLNCNKFHYCSSELRAIPYVCPHYYVYDPISHLCRVHRTPQDCPTINCYQFPNQFVSYTLDRSLYIFCNIDNNGNIRPLLYQCTSETVFNIAKQGCEFVCIGGEGRFEYPGDQSKYYLCLMTNYGEVAPFVMSCDELSRFESGRCKLLEENHIEGTTTEAATTTTLHHAIAFVPITVPMTQNLSNTG